MTDLHELVSGFTDVDAYERGRPGYPPEAVAPILEALGVDPGARVVDLGAGTGKLSRGLLAAGLDVVALEPLPHMRAALERAVGPERVLAATAEATTLPDASADAVTAADSFHWFREAGAIAEMHRILRPGGGVALLWSIPAWRESGPGWHQEVGALIYGVRPLHPGFSGRRPEAAFAEAGGFEPVRASEIVTEQPTDREGLLAYVASISWIGAMAPDARAEVLAGVDAILRRHGVEAIVQPIRTELYVTRHRRG